MRVRISYGTDIEDVPQELEQLFMYVSEKTHSVLRQVRQIEEFLADEEIESAVSLMDKLRLGLADIDNRIADTNQIASGYINYKENEGRSYGTNSIQTISGKVRNFLFVGLPI